MAGRIRSVKPEWLVDERLVLASDAARVLTIALLLMADDYGNGRANRVVLAAHVFPGAPVQKLDTALSEVVESLSFAELYEADGQSYYHVRNWEKHQRVDKPGKPQVPGPPGARKKSRESSRQSRETPGNLPGAVAKDVEGLAPRARPLPSLPIPSTPEGEAGEGDRETVVPLDLTERAERAGIPEQFAKAYRAPIEVVRAEIRETVTYWSIGGGAGKRKKRWLSVLRTRLHERGKAGALNVPEPEPTLDPGETRRKRETEERAITERRRSEVAAAVGAPPNVDAARAALAALSQELGE
jgi:hypothetical protein